MNQQDRTLSDLLETYRHLQSDPEISDVRKQRAAKRMEGVWADLAKLQDPDGFVNHISEVVQREHRRREDPPEGEERRAKALCRCDLSHHVCETKQGEVPSKIRTQDLQYIQKPSSRELARKYVQEHPGDVIIREAMESFRNLRADIYSELSSILAMMMGAEDSDTPSDSDGVQDTRDAASERPDTANEPSPSDPPDPADAATASADGVVDTEASDVTEGGGGDGDE